MKNVIILFICIGITIPFGKIHAKPAPFSPSEKAILEEKTSLLPNNFGDEEGGMYAPLALIFVGVILAVIYAMTKNENTGSFGNVFKNLSDPDYRGSNPYSNSPSYLGVRPDQSGPAHRQYKR